MTWGNRKTPQILTFRTKMLIALFALILLFVLIMDARAESQGEPVFVEHVVRAGESLWGLSKQYNPGMDPRESVWHIREVNNITPLIYPGQKLIIPIF